MGVQENAHFMFVDLVVLSYATGSFTNIVSVFKAAVWLRNAVTIWRGSSRSRPHGPLRSPVVLLDRDVFWRKHDSSRKKRQVKKGGKICRHLTFNLPVFRTEREAVGLARYNERSVGAFCCKHIAEGMKANPLKVYASLVVMRSKGVLIH
jgi:hypothetical protein